MTGSAVAPATITCCSGSSVSSAAETTKVACFSSSSIVGSALTSFSNCSSGRSGRIFLPSGPSTGAAGSTTSVAASAAFLAAAFFAGAVLAVVAFLAGASFAEAFLAGAASSRRRLLGRRTLGRRLLRGLGGGGLLRRGRRGRLGGDRHRHRDPEGAQVGQQGLQVSRLDGRLVTGTTYVVGGDTAGGTGLLDQIDHGWVREHLGGDLARVRSHEHLSSNWHLGRGKAR